MRTASTSCCMDCCPRVCAGPEGCRHSWQGVSRGSQQCLLHKSSAAVRGPTRRLGDASEWKSSLRRPAGLHTASPCQGDIMHCHRPCCPPAIVKAPATAREPTACTAKLPMLTYRQQCDADARMVLRLFVEVKAVLTLIANVMPS